MTAHDIQEALQTLAQAAPDTANLHNELVPRIRRRRRIRQAIWTVTLVCGVGAATAGVIMSVSMSGPEPAGPGNPPGAATAPTPASRFGTCGSRITLQPDPTLPLQLAAFPPAAPVTTTDKPTFIQIDMTVRNISDSAMHIMTMRSGAKLALTKDGIVVASPGGMRAAGWPYTIDAGATQAYKSSLNLVSCDTNSGLAPGHYQLHAQQTFVLNHEAVNRGPTILVYGGPWDIEIR